MKKNTNISTKVRVSRDKNTGLWYYEHNEMKSQPIFKNKKIAWAKGNQYVNFLIKGR
jgi:hypothetical protein